MARFKMRVKFRFVVRFRDHSVRNTVIAQQGISGNQYLAFVRWVGEAFRVSGHGSVEHYLAAGVDAAAEATAFKTRPVLQHEGSFRLRVHLA